MATGILDPTKVYKIGPNGQPIATSLTSDPNAPIDAGKQPQTQDQPPTVPNPGYGQTTPPPVAPAPPPSPTAIGTKPPLNPALPSYQNTGITGGMTGGIAKYGTAPTTPGTPNQDVYSFIRSYQQSHGQADLNGLLTALKQAGYSGVDHYYYGTTPSGNELSINGVKYKVISEGGASPSWYLAGTEDGGGAPALNLGGIMGAGGASSTGANPQMSDAVNQAILKLLSTPQATDAQTLLNSPEAAAERLGSQRLNEQQQAQLAEQSAQNGTLGTGGEQGAARGLLQARSEGDAKFLGTLATQKMQQNYQQLKDAIAFATQAGQFDKAQALQLQLAQLEAELRRQGFDVQTTLANNQLGFDYTQLQTNANQAALLALLQGGGA